ncbi:MAG: cytochrome b [Aestuariivirga sp.]|uniref:cytochrome b n=1 Tax=Aestuariivirga sp. TaxID=2650926 RepID=UPI0025BCE330|nr:cytochrome b [Aestuariivirga sp.]MCA3561292.1 cytochrome b [Aestuariivirga sp.]
MSLVPKNRYDGVAMIIHWLTAVLMIYMVFFGEDLMKEGEHLAKAGDTANATFEPSIHVSLGVSILLLTVLRIVWRLTHTAPAYPASMKRYEVVGSKSLHGLFYLLLIAVPLTGWIAFGGFSEEVPAMAQAQVFGLFAMPQPPFSGEWAGELHGLGANAAMVFIGLHVLAALKHQFIDKDAIFGRMLPW